MGSKELNSAATGDLMNGKRGVKWGTRPPDTPYHSQVQYPIPLGAFTVPYSFRKYKKEQT